MIDVSTIGFVGPIGLQHFFLSFFFLLKWFVNRMRLAWLKYYYQKNIIVLFFGWCCNISDKRREKNSMFWHYNVWTADANKINENVICISVSLKFITLHGYRYESLNRSHQSFKFGRFFSMPFFVSRKCADEHY